jgi:hypothetical protein
VGSHVTYGILRMMPWIAPLESHEEGAQRGGVDPCCAGEDGAPRCLTNDKALRFYLEGYHHVSNPKG